MRNVDFAILGLDPSQLVNYFISPLIHALVPNVHLRVKDPQKAKAFRRQGFHWYINNFLITHGRVL
jgi:hypothetical protein